MSESQKKKFSTQLLGLTKLVGKAMGDHAMIKDGDRVLVAVSGRKGSMLLWEMLKYFQQVAPIVFEIKPAFVDTGGQGFTAKVITEYFKAQGFPCRVVKVGSLYRATKNRVRNFSAIPKHLLAWAKRNKFNKIALGLNLDDIAQAVLTDLFFNAEVGAVSPIKVLANGAVTVICPLAYVQAQEIGKIVLPEGAKVFCEKNSPDIDPDRALVEKLLAEVEKGNPFAKKNVIRALRYIKWEYLP